MATIPTLRYPLAHLSYGNEEVAAVVQTLNRGQTTCGPLVSAFEHMFAEYVGRKHAVMVNSGSSADMLIAFGLGEATLRDEILVPAVTWPTQVWACLVAGYRVKLVDVDPATLQFDVADMERKISPKTRALFPVHVLGNVGNMDEVARLAGTSDQISVLEDCCEALGSRWQGSHVGIFGQAAAYSFFFSHLISTMEGGMVVTDDDAAARTFRLLRSHGWEPTLDERFWFPTWGFNVRPTEVQGAFGGVQMGKLDEFRRIRTANYARLKVATADLWPQFLSTPVVHDDCDPSWHGFPLMLTEEAPFKKRDLLNHLEEWGIETRPLIAGNLARQPMCRNDWRISAGPLPGADAIQNRGFYIGLPSFHDEVGGAHVASAFDAFLERC